MAFALFRVLLGVVGVMVLMMGRVFVENAGAPFGWFFVLGGAACLLAAVAGPRRQAVP